MVLKERKIDRKKHYPDLTPGEIVKTVNPSSSRARAYCTVSMLRAALDTL